MRILRDRTAIPPDARGASAAIGNFDGVHLGHQAVIDLARRSGQSLGVVTFEPHPREYFAPTTPPFRLMNAQARAHRLQMLGVETLFELRFDAALAALSPEEFVRDVLARDLGLSHAVVGEDFRFGKGRAGSAETLRDLGPAAGIAVTVAPMVELGASEVSSTAIRQALSEGRPRDAARMLGHWHRIEGPVEHGEKRGRELGYPTANLSIAGLHPPRFGIYAVKADVLDGPHAGSYGGAASIGVRPQFGGEVPNCETFLFDFSGDLYGATLSVALVDYLRPEMTFDGLPALIRQMDADCLRAREILAHA
ncbi:Riboflavin kinase / FMN adenylyltransferase [Rubellimicrobium mesophilum DSM 19309]|uniref:Riboflavin biosynthesis protein n=1 Tax=Rubellimicrobium mesophilum DSM 19309 TaxID=442562 RepID=A0A017HV22_9RHOB|nr:bifunctional riboflavin kinase/FAD synthetase [Rubellimicrobium mesophilum]EYD77574.1 Riboflavin kinase / FMN adenylyltransferase [Rubellimicrobium mesophilum DSM 19309]